MSATDSARRRKKGFVIILTTLTLFVTVPMVGLAIDLSTLYFIRTKLSTALDAAVLAGARALGTGTTPAQQAASARTAAQRFFNANFPSGYWGTSNLNFAPPTIDDTSNPTYRTVGATASVSAPLYFMRILGQNTSAVAATATAGRRDAVVVLVLDRSGSMNWSMSGGGTACDAMKQDALTFLGYLAQGRDAVGLVVFDTNVYTLPVSTNFTGAESAINQMICGGGTGSASGLAAGYKLLTDYKVSTLTANFIVFETDGRPNAVYADYSAFESVLCKPTGPLVGLITPDNGGVINNHDNTAAMFGIQNNSVTDPGIWLWANNSSGCQNQNYASNVVSSMPQKDYMNHFLRGDYVGNQNNAYSLLSPAPDYQYQLPNLANVDSPRDIVRAAANSVDNEAWQIRIDPAKITVMAIGLAGTSGSADGPDTWLLRKVANDPTMKADPSPTVQSWYAQQSNQPQGFFAFAPDPSQLSAAFNAVATQIVIRLAN